MRDLPIAAWLVVLASVAFAGEYVWLRVCRRQNRAAGEAAERRLASLASAPQDYATRHGQELPASVESLVAEGADHVRYLPAPRLDLDARLILLVDLKSTQKVIEFPYLRDGRGVVFCSGRLLVASNEVIDRLLLADRSLRRKLGLRGAEDGAEE